MTLEEYLTQIAELVAAGRAVNWELGDQAAEMVREYGRGIIGKIAETAGCSAARVRQLIAVAMEFPPEIRWPDVDWSVYRQARLTAKRLGKEVQEVLQMAVDNRYSAADLAILGRGEERPSKLVKRCEYCGFKIAIEGPGGRQGLRIECLVCHAEGRETLLGVLE